MNLAARFSRILAATFALVVLAGCTGFDSPGSDGPAAEAPVYRIGDRWVLSAADGFRNPVRWEETWEVVAIGADGIDVRVTQKGPTVDTARSERWVAPGQVAVGAVFDNETRRFTPPMRRYAFPLRPSQTWNEWLDNFNESTATQGRFNRFVRVGGWDTVTTPAGTFDAIRLRVLMRLDDETFWRFATECNYLLWYAPAVRGVVRAEKNAQYRERGDDFGGIAIQSQHAVLELVAFTPGK